MPPSPLAVLDGHVLPAGEAMLPVTDEGLLRGDGVFEVMRVYEGRPFALEQHLRRMVRSAANLRLELDLTAVRRDLDALLAEAGPVDAAVRFLVTRGCSPSVPTRRGWPPSSTCRRGSSTTSSRSAMRVTCSRPAWRRRRAPTRRCS
jgi:branched-subunit amino acid aminotransferase/4-amino-4-deoxychorismate lyase